MSDETGGWSFSFGASPVWWLFGIPQHSQGQGEGRGAFCLTKPTSLILGALVGHRELAISLHGLHTVPEAQLLNIPSNQKPGKPRLDPRKALLTLKQKQPCQHRIIANANRKDVHLFFSPVAVPTMPPPCDGHSRFLRLATEGGCAGGGNNQSLKNLLRESSVKK